MPKRFNCGHTGARLVEVVTPKSGRKNVFDNRDGTVGRADTVEEAHLCGPCVSAINDNPSDKRSVFWEDSDA